jgi:hypothetical protein
MLHFQCPLYTHSFGDCFVLSLQVKRNIYAYMLYLQTEKTSKNPNLSPPPKIFLSCHWMSLTLINTNFECTQFRFQLCYMLNSTTILKCLLILSKQILGCRDMWPLYPQHLALTSPTSCGRLVCIVLSRTQATEFSFLSF